LSLPASLPLFGAFVHHHARGPSIVPNAHDLEHVTPLQQEFIGSPWLIRPQDSNSITGMYVVLRVIVLEKWQLF
jgi:hypothetical protein